MSKPVQSRGSSYVVVGNTRNLTLPKPVQSKGDSSNVVLGKTRYFTSFFKSFTKQRAIL